MIRRAGCVEAHVRIRGGPAGVTWPAYPTSVAGNVVSLFHIWDGYAECMRDLVDRHYPDAERIRVVLDNLSTHTPTALYETF